MNELIYTIIVLLFMTTTPVLSYDNTTEYISNDYINQEKNEISVKNDNIQNENVSEHHWQTITGEEMDKLVDSLSKIGTDSTSEKAEVDKILEEGRINAPAKLDKSDNEATRMINAALQILDSNSIEDDSPVEPYLPTVHDTVVGTSSEGYFAADDKLGDEVLMYQRSKLITNDKVLLGKICLFLWFLYLIISRICSTINANLLLIKYYSSEQKLLNILDNCIRISENYLNEISLHNQIYKKIFLSEVIQAVIINSLSMFKISKNFVISEQLFKGLFLMNKKIVKIFIPTMSEHSINKCYSFRIKQYDIFYNYAVNNKLYRQDEIKENYSDLFRMTLAQLKVFYIKDIMYFKSNEIAIPLVNADVFKKLQCANIDLENEDLEYKNMIIKLQNECINFTNHLNFLNQNKEEFYKKLYNKKAIDVKSDR